MPRKIVAFIPGGFAGKVRRQIPDLSAKGYRRGIPGRRAKCYIGPVDQYRRGSMKGRLPRAILVLAMSFVAAPIPARAADPAFCKPYARAALVQVREALASPHCGAGLQGVRWSTEFSVHYEWCLGASLDAAAVERDARQRLLKTCTDR
jgi:hypothetical protein